MPIHTSPMGQPAFCGKGTGSVQCNQRDALFIQFIKI
jgi:hypothetical protein